MSSQKTRSFKITSNSPTKLPAGKYWLGDPYHATGLELEDFIEITGVKSGARSVNYPEGKHVEAYFPDGVNLEGKTCWYGFPKRGNDCFQMVKNTLQNVQVSDQVFFRTPGLIGIVPFDLTVDSAADYSSGMVVTFDDAVKVTYDGEQLCFKSGKRELVIASLPYKHIDIGFDLSHLAKVDQSKRRLYLIEQFSRFAYGLSGGYIGPAYKMNDYLQITVHCNDDPYKVFPDLVSKLVSGEIDIPEDKNDGLVFKYALISFVDFDDPIVCLKEMSSDCISHDMFFDRDSPSGECVSAKLERMADLFEERGKEFEQRGNESEEYGKELEKRGFVRVRRLDISASSADQDMRNEYIEDQCIASLFYMRAKRLRIIAGKLAIDTLQVVV